MHVPEESVEVQQGEIRFFVIGLWFALFETGDLSFDQTAFAALHKISVFGRFFVQDDPKTVGFSVAVGFLWYSLVPDIYRWLSVAWVRSVKSLATAPSIALVDALVSGQ